MNRDWERLVSEIALINASVFYIVAVVMFVIARKNRLNLALAVQKSLWWVVITLMTLPFYFGGEAWLDQRARMVVWIGVSIATWWVLIEVYRANFGRRRREANAATTLEITTLTDRDFPTWPSNARPAAEPGEDGRL
jgi:hypothetical protein